MRCTTILLLFFLLTMRQTTKQQISWVCTAYARAVFPILRTTLLPKQLPKKNFEMYFCLWLYYFNSSQKSSYQAAKDERGIIIIKDVLYTHTITGNEQ